MKKSLLTVLTATIISTYTTPSSAVFFTLASLETGSFSKGVNRVMDDGELMFITFGGGAAIAVAQALTSGAANPLLGAVFAGLGWVLGEDSPQEESLVVAKSLMATGASEPEASKLAALIVQREKEEAASGHPKIFRVSDAREVAPDFVTSGQYNKWLLTYGTPTKAPGAEQ